MSKRVSGGLTLFLVIVALLVGALGGFLYHGVSTAPSSDQLPVGGNAAVGAGDNEFEIHFIDQESIYTGDCIYLRAGTVDILIDAGPRASAVPLIADYLNDHMQDDVLDYVIVTHADQDHIAGFGTNENTDSIFDLFEVRFIIDFPLTGKDTQVYRNYLRERDAEVAAGATHYTALECIENGMQVITLSQHVKMTILNSYFYTHSSSDENNYSVCVLFTQGEHHYLFTGDLERKGEEYLVQMNDLPKVDIFKGGHHGSSTSSTPTLLSVIQPEIVVYTCVAFSNEYATFFPTQQTINNVAAYTERVYVTGRYDAATDSYQPCNGTVVFVINGDDLAIACSGTDTVFGKTEWFDEYLETPVYWQ